MELEKQLLEHPRHDNIKFTEKTHTYQYFPDGDFRKTKSAIEFGGHSAWFDQYRDVFDAEKQAELSSKNPNSDWYGMTPEEILTAWKKKGDESRAYGNDIDRAITECVNLGVYDEDMGGYLDEFWKTMDKEGLRPIVAQLVIYDEDIERASAIDVVAIRETTGKLVIIDVKSFQDGMEFYPYKGKTFNVPLHPLLDSKFNKASLQVSLYQYWLENKYEFDIDERFIYLINETQSELIPATDYTEFIEKLYAWESEDTDPI